LLNNRSTSIELFSDDDEEFSEGSLKVFGIKKKKEVDDKIMIAIIT
jgi:hypothetical protein